MHHGRSGVLAGVSVLALLAAAPVPVSVAQSAAKPFAIGYLQTIDNVGMLEVVARFTGGKWVNTWQGSGDQRDPVLPLDQIPRSWLGKPVSREWTAWSADGSRRVVHIAGTARGPACEAPTMLTLAVGEAGPVDTSEVAVDGDQRLLGFRELGLSDHDADRAAMEGVALDAFRAKAPAAIAGFRGNSLLPASALTAEALSGQAVRVAFLARPRSSAPAIAYFEVFQPTKAETSYGVRTAGWIRLNGGRWSALAAVADVVGSDSSPIPMRRPLGVFRLAGHDYLLVRLIGYEGWATGIYEPDGNTMREILVTPGGGC